MHTGVSEVAETAESSLPVAVRQRLAAGRLAPFYQRQPSQNHLDPDAWVLFAANSCIVLRTATDRQRTCNGIENNYTVANPAP